MIVYCIVVMGNDVLNIFIIFIGKFKLLFEVCREMFRCVFVSARG